MVLALNASCSFYTVHATGCLSHSTFSIDEQSKQPLFHALLQTPDLMQQGLLADYIVAQQLFAFWLPDLCQPGSPAQKLFWKITEIAWRQQSLLSVMGYYAHQEVSSMLWIMPHSFLVPPSPP